MRLSGRSEPFDSDEFIYELKIDGFRALAVIELHLLIDFGAFPTRIFRIEFPESRRELLWPTKPVFGKWKTTT